VQLGWPHFAHALLERGANVEATDAVGDTVLNMAVRDGNTLLVAMALNYSANTEVLGSDGYTPLVAATKLGFFQMVQTIIRHTPRPNLDATDENGNTPLVICGMNGFHEMSINLVDYGANKEALEYKGNHGETVAGVTALWRGAWSGYRDFVYGLIARGANMEVADTYTGSTPLHIAAERGYDGMIYDLLNWGANRDSLDADGETPICRAIKGAHFASVKLLYQWGTTGLNRMMMSIGTGTPAWCGCASDIVSRDGACYQRNNILRKLCGHKILLRVVPFGT